MKKQILSAILMAAVILTTTACSGKTDVSEPSSPSESEVTAEAAPESTPAATAEKQEQAEDSAVTFEDATSAATTAPEEAAEPDERSIISIEGFENGSLYFKASDGIWYLYDVVENRIYEIIDDWRTGARRLRFYKMGDLICVWAGDYDWYNYCVVNTVTNEIILNNQNADGLKFRHFDTETGRILVTKVSESFSGNSMSIGVMNSKGEWDYPLRDFSIDGVSVDNLNEDELFLMGDYVFYSRGDKAYYYSLKDNTVKLASDSIDQNIYACYNNYSNKAIFKTSEGICAFDDSGECRIICTDDVSFSDSVKNYGEVFEVCNSKRERSIYSWDDYKNLGFDLSEYTIERIYAANKNTVAFSTKNPDGVNYLIIMNRDGSLVTDPIKGDCSYMQLCRDYAIIMDTKTIINCKTGETRTYDNVDITDEKTGMATVRVDKKWYLIDLSDPDALLNPFELAAQ